MNTHADKKQENKSQSVSNGESQMQSGGESTFQFVDNRPEAVAQRKLQEMSNNSPQVRQAAQLQTVANNHTAQQQQPIQKKESIEDKRERVKRAQQGTDLGGGDAAPLIIEPSGEVLDAESAKKKQRLQDKRKRIEKAQKGTDLGGGDESPITVDPSGVATTGKEPKELRLKTKKERIKRAQQGTDLGSGDLRPIISNPNGESYLEFPEMASQKSDDMDLDYGSSYKESGLNKKSVLRKVKVMYSEKNKKGQGTKIPANSLIEYVDSSNKLLGRNWSKIKFKGKEGWINTTSSIDKESNIVKHESAGEIMPNGIPTVEDVKQGMFGSCFLLSALMSLAQNDPNYIKTRLFQTDPTKDSENHTVRFFNVEGYPGNLKFTPVAVTVKNTIFQLNTNLGSDKPSGKHIGSHGSQHWPAIIEKAWNVFPNKSSNSRGLFGGHGNMASAILTGQEYKDLNILDSGISSEKEQLVKSGEAGTMEEAGEIILNKNREFAKSSIIESFLNPKQAKNLKTAGTQQTPPKEWGSKDGQGDTGEQKVGGICFGHQYSIEEANDTEIFLRNPWGRYSRVRGEVKPDEAVSILTWAEFFETFAEASVGS